MTRLRFGNDPWTGQDSTYEEEQFTPEPREEDGVCSTCRGTGLVPNGLPSNGPDPCPDCGPETSACWPSWGELHDGGSPSKYRRSVVCGDCKIRLHASSEDRLRARMKEHAP